LLELLTPPQRVRLAILASAMLVSAFLEMLSVASVLPFLTVAADPARIQSNPWLSWSYQTFGFASETAFLGALAGATLCALLLSNGWMAATHWAQLRFAHGWNHGLGVRLLRQYLAKPYVFFLRQNGADLGRNILYEVEQVAAQVIVPGLRLCGKAAVVLAIVTLLMVVEPVLALIVTGALGGSYGALYLHVRPPLARFGRQRLASSAGRFRAASDAFGAIKDLKLLGREDEPVARFEQASGQHARAQASAAIVAELPRYALDVLAFGSILVVALHFLLRGEGLQQAMPYLGLYAFAGYRLMPSLQQVFQSYARLRFGAAALAHLHGEMVGSEATVRACPARGARVPVGAVLRLVHRLEAEGVSFRYQGASRPTLRDVELTIEARTMVGIVGPTGAGKTTLVDVLLGLLRPQTGEIRIDGYRLTDDKLRAWQNAIGYVPQQIYLSDDTIVRNIAFGIPDRNIDRDSVERAARIAHIHEFIVEDLPDGYESAVGERGIRLSGGQRQRLGIARALYHDPAVLVFDEATNALDQDTEAAVMDAINELAGTRTILIVAHRPTSLRRCDGLIRVTADGRVVCERFRAPATVTGAREWGGCGPQVPSADPRPLTGAPPPGAGRR
jgi:ATP-binding cassette subfamily C protein